MTENKMREILIEKVTVNIGVGAPGDKLEHAKGLLERLTDGKAVETHARRRDPVFKLRKGLPIGAKVTLRGEGAKTFLDKALNAKRRQLKSSNFDRQGNFAFGIHEYIDFPGAKYDPGIAMFGFDICVSLARKGGRVSIRKLRPSNVGRHHRVTRDEAMDFAKNSLAVKIE
ncbi:50S ribosomal protein L5 [Candidatus Bilamarchaeum dharawalense]|uniref:50S ribosomal protein L5 n=1 Tax=Candidatus Bilamarchaeum dharawalense TaxID=2885759 RepID=A0A5E4LS02_9ARCH|nr:50S ribosomal protein L5 [Candidatus Bilamarchaeum dharawalense]